MAKNLDTIVDAHRAARERREAGRPIWDETVHVNTIWDDATLTQREKGEKIAAAIKKSRWYKNADPFDTLHELVEYLATEDDPREAGGLMNEIRDEATHARVWFA